MVIVDSALAAAAGLEPLGIVRAWASAGVEPADTGLAPTVAIPKALGRAGLEVGDVDLWEINEAFASMCVATTRILGIDESIVNVLGSGCSLGHPVATTGARMVISLIHELRRRGGGTGVAAMCAGGGMSTAVVIDVPAPRAAALRPAQPRGLRPSRLGAVIAVVAGLGPAGHHRHRRDGGRCCRRG